MTVLRSGIPDTLPGRSVNLCERGISAMFAGELVSGEAVAIEVQLPQLPQPLRARALVRYQDQLCCGLEFVGLSSDQRGAIRDWAKDAKAEAVMSEGATALMSNKTDDSGTKSPSSGGPSGPPPKRRHPARWAVFLVFVAIAVAVFWWRWNRVWAELESGLKRSEISSREKPQAQVPTEVMQKLLVHKVEPIYPAEARQRNLEGIIALDIVVGRDGSVVGMHALNGPELLARAASVFGTDLAAAPAIDLKELHAKIGQLALENDFLAGALSKAGMLSAKR